MVRRAQLQRKTGSPLISGYLTPRGVNWGWIVAAFLALAIAAGAAWYVWLR
jgi:hypothetical protein